ncbi:hypothetical protein [Methylosinus sp. R-45379]|uniref:hypothetical protein n=1 Tax=Methylosinus sp. R-45379 TaxID=980563 RepID=UPI0012EE5B81|nr:hypothetical protein [Methylosinus sp. R-45379]
MEIRYQTQLRHFYQWLIEHNLYCGPPPKFNGKSDEVFADLPRDRLVDEEVIRLVSAALFTGCDGPQRLWQKGKYFIQSDLYWIFLILLLTGMRTGEPPQIRLDDIVRVEDLDPVTGEPLVLYFFDMRPYDPAQGRKPIKELKHLKRADFARVVPIHPLLIELGLLERAARLRKRGETRLFPGWEAHVSRKGEVRWGKRISRAFAYARTLPDVNLTRSNICLYATRHLMADWLDSLRAPQRVRNRVMGHKDKANDESNAADAYGGKGMMSVEQARIVLELETPLIKRMREILVGALRSAERGELIRLEVRGKPEEAEEG